MRLGNLPHQLELRDNSGLETTLRTDKKRFLKNIEVKILGMLSKIAKSYFKYLFSTLSKPTVIFHKITTDQN